MPYNSPLYPSLPTAISFNLEATGYVTLIFSLSAERRQHKRQNVRLARSSQKDKHFRRAWTPPQEVTSVVPFHIEKMDIECSSCHALMFPWEKSKGNGDKRSFSACCDYGKIQLKPFRDPPPKLRSLFDRQTQQSRQFLENIRQYNGLVAMASKNVTGNIVEFHGRGPRPFKMSGQMYHLTPSAVFPDSGKQPKFSQIFVFDQDNELKNRLQQAKGNEVINKNTLTLIQEELKRVNPLVKSFKSGAEIFKANPSKDLKMVFKAKSSQGAKKRHLNPDVPDVVVVAPGEQTAHRDIVLYRNTADAPNQRNTTRISELHPFYDPSVFVLILLYGDAGFSIDNPITKVPGNSKVTLQEFFRFHFQQRTTSFNTLLKAGKLLHEYFCDQYSKIEGSRLKYYRNKELQEKYRVHQYSGLIDHVATLQSQPGQTEESRIGQRIILPASHTGSPRYLYKHYLDALAIATRYKKFDIFMTMTANPKWVGVQENLFPKQQACDRPDIVNKVFKRKLGALIDDVNVGVFGKMKARVHTIEGQMRGLKHAHMLLLLQEVLTVTDIDQIIRADIPDPEKEPELYELVTQFMLHGPCGTANPNSTCMDKGKCSKKFPKDFCEETRLPHDGHGYPLYRRPKKGHTIKKNGFVFDSRWVVPYNPWVLEKYQCHINVEFVGSFHTIKYLYKYVHKGVDVGTVAIENKDEISTYVNARLIDAYDSHWRAMEYKIQDRFPAVMSLAIHTEGQQNIIFREGKAQEALAAAKDTSLQGFYKLNRSDQEARQYLYMEIPEHYTWNDEKREWKKRVQQPKGGEVPRMIGRMCNVSVVQGERFYLKLLLAHVRGPQSEEDLKVYGGKTYTTFKEAALATGLLEDDGEWIAAMHEVSCYAGAKKVRETFALILHYCHPSEPKKLFETFLEQLSDDLIHDVVCAQRCSRDCVDMDLITTQVLHAIDDNLSQMGGSLSTHKDMPQPRELTDQEKLTIVYRSETFNKDEQRQIVQLLGPKMNHKQSEICEAVHKATHAGKDDKIPRQLIVNAPGGYGKTYTFKMIAAKIRAEGGIVLCVGSTGLAAQNLEGGRTAHSRFNIPIPVFEDSVCRIKGESALEKLIKHSTLIIWDEIFSIHRFNVECVERTLRDLMNSEQPWGGKAVLFGGDSMQTTPVVKRASRAQIVQACIQASPLYPPMQQLKLEVNMRTDEAEVEFSSYLLDVGKGRIQHEDSEIQVQIPPEYLVEDLNTLVSEIFPDLQNGCIDKDNLLKGTIYTPLNQNIKQINNVCLAEFPGEERTYFSADSVLEDNYKESLPVEYLNSLSPSGMPEHEIKLKVGAPVMLLRNLQGDPTLLLRNGTRMVVVQMMDRVIECEISLGTNKGQRVFLPRIPHHDRSDELPFTFVRRQFPVKLAFSVTINKGQGQENERVGIYLPQPVFAHGQLYTAFSRAKRASSVKMFIEGNDEGITENIVYKELL